MGWWAGASALRCLLWGLPGWTVGLRDDPAASDEPQRRLADHADYDQHALPEAHPDDADGHTRGSGCVLRLLDHSTNCECNHAGLAVRRRPFFFFFFPLFLGGARCALPLANRPPPSFHSAPTIACAGIRVPSNTSRFDRTTGPHLQGRSMSLATWAASRTGETTSHRVASSIHHGQ